MGRRRTRTRQQGDRLTPAALTAVEKRGRNRLRQIYESRQLTGSGQREAA